MPGPGVSEIFNDDMHVTESQLAARSVKLHWRRWLSRLCWTCSDCDLYIQISNYNAMLDLLILLMIMVFVDWRFHGRSFEYSDDQLGQ